MEIILLFVVFKNKSDLDLNNTLMDLKIETNSVASKNFKFWVWMEIILLFVVFKNKSDLDLNNTLMDLKIETNSVSSKNLNFES